MPCPGILPGTPVSLTNSVLSSRPARKAFSRRHQLLEREEEIQMSPLHRSLLAITVCTLALNCPATLVAQNASSPDRAHTGSPDSAVPAIAVEELPDSPGALWA